MKIKYNFLLLIIFAVIITLLKTIATNGITQLDEHVIVNLQYMNKDALINIYENSIFILPYLIINIFNIMEVKEFSDNKIFMVSRFGSINKYNCFMLKKILTITFKNTLYYFAILIGIGLCYTNINNTSIILILKCFFNLLLIELFFSLLFYFLLAKLTSQYCYLLNIILILLSSITGFLFKYLEKDVLYEANFMTGNVLTELHKLVTIQFKYFNIIIMILIAIVGIGIIYRITEE